MTKNISIIGEDYKTTIPKGVRNEINLEVGSNIFWYSSKDGKKLIGTPIIISDIE